ncbi:beta-mannosidase [Plodia interpunctella]|uniref:beta-mannosidase n=1 Tax=Plodia interpunctella TaxID=58824 RepID=UPI002367DDA1|nr:beta-mannosidase [Plodia interpunctella]
MFGKGVVFVVVIFTIKDAFCHIDYFDLNSINAVWTVENKNGSEKIKATVPGGIYSDLQNAGVIGDILSGFNDVLTRWVAHETWTYTGKFNVSEEYMRATTAHLVFHGLDTIASVELNDVTVGTTNNMFVRYLFDVKQHLKTGENVLKVSFTSPIEAAQDLSENHFTAPSCVPENYNGECHANQLRKMQASFSWDWGPAFPSVGIWKPVVLEFYNSAIIRSVTTRTENRDQKWHLNVKVYLESSRSSKQIEGRLFASMLVEGKQMISVGKDVAVQSKEDGTAEVDMEMSISENSIRRWWPNGYGDQRLYRLSVIFTSTKDRFELSKKQLKVGFRTIEVIQEDASRILGNTTSGKGLTFYFKINGYPLFMKGSNWIPAHILPERGDDKSTVDGLLTAARDAHMNMLRVWGGGVYESDYFYNKCDELGILIWQDFLFACSMYPAYPEFLDNVKTEIEQNVLRLQSHPSIAIWAGNNENEVALRGNWYETQPQFEKYKNEYIKLYVDTIKPIVAALDDREYLVSSPSNGVESEQEGYIAENPYDPYFGDTHYYNYVANNWDMNIYPRTRFASEYGFQSLPSIATMRTATTNPEDFKLDSRYLNHRQHSPDGYIFIHDQMHKNLKLKEANDTKYFEKFVFYSQITQAIAMKAETEFYRQEQAHWYTMGALYWQLNDVWQAPSWSGIEYGGKWKMLHYYAKWFFAPVLVSPRLLLSGDVDVYLINDRFVPIVEAQIIVDYFNYSSLVPVFTQTFPANVGALSSKKQDFGLSTWVAGDETFLRFSLRAEGVPSSPYNYLFPKPLKSVVGLKKPYILISVQMRKHENKKYPGKTIYPVDIKVNTVVLFLWLETNARFSAHHRGYFEENGLIVTKPYYRVNYISDDILKPKQIEDAITYQYYLH